MPTDAPTRDLRHRLSARIGWTAAVGMVLILAAGADRPPPPGFLAVLPWAASLAVLIHRGLPRILRTWAAGRAAAALLRSAGTGLAFGAVSWAVLSLVNTGEPTVDVDLAARVTGLVVVGLAGAVAGAAVAGAGRALEVRATRRG